MKTPSLALEECIRAYDREIARKNSLESKASALLSTSAIVVSLLNSFIAFIIAGIVNFSNFGILIVLNVGTTILIGISIYWSLSALKIKEHFFPFDVKDPNVLQEKLDKKEVDLIIDLIDQYSAIIPQINKFNEDKVDLIDKSWKLLIGGIFVSFIGFITTIFINKGV